MTRRLENEKVLGINLFYCLKVDICNCKKVFDTFLFLFPVQSFQHSLGRRGSLYFHNVVKTESFRQCHLLVVFNLLSHITNWTKCSEVLALGKYLNVEWVLCIILLYDKQNANPTTFLLTLLPLEITLRHLKTNKHMLLCCHITTI